ncbi:MAG: hypothetical protein IJ688_11090, partial [Treponema sp.]|nr:hypothetical protein [Treponema sp.]
MKNKLKTFVKILGILATCLMFASFSPSLDGRAVVVEQGVFPQGLFAKTVGYLPGDIISVANITGDSTVDLLVIGALDPSDGIAIMLSPEAAAAIGINKNDNNIVKITKRNGQNERVYGTAVIAKQNTAPESSELNFDIAEEDFDDFEEDAFEEEDILEEESPEETAEEASPEEAPVEESPAEESPAEEAPATEAPAEETEEFDDEEFTEESVAEEDFAEEDFAEEPAAEIDEPFETIAAEAYEEDEDYDEYEDEAVDEQFEDSEEPEQEEAYAESEALAEPAESTEPAEPVLEAESEEAEAEEEEPAEELVTEYVPEEKWEVVIPDDVWAEEEYAQKPVESDISDEVPAGTPYEEEDVLDIITAPAIARYENALAEAEDEEDGSIPYSDEDVDTETETETET